LREREGPLAREMTATLYRDRGRATAIAVVSAETGGVLGQTGA
jgi:hypothetical protein